LQISRRLYEGDRGDSFSNAVAKLSERIRASRLRHQQRKPTSKRLCDAGVDRQTVRRHGAYCGSLPAIRKADAVPKCAPWHVLAIALT
jgi:hypothetical protein